MKIYDITHEVSKDIAVWPGDLPFERNESTIHIKEDVCNVSSIKAGLHLGTHLDAHYHYSKDGKSMDEHSLENYIGSCQVIHVMHAKGNSIEVSDLKTTITEKRVILRTKEVSDSTLWDPNFKGLSAELVDYFNSKGVMLVGTDAPSVDLFNEESMRIHNLFNKYDMYIVENLNLNEIRAGVYDFIALPLKIKGADGSPVRAVLIDRDTANE